MSIELIITIAIIILAVISILLYVSYKRKQRELPEHTTKVKQTFIQDIGEASKLYTTISLLDPDKHPTLEEWEQRRVRLAETGMNDSHINQIVGTENDTFTREESAANMSLYCKTQNVEAEHPW